MKTRQKIFAWLASLLIAVSMLPAMPLTADSSIGTIEIDGIWYEYNMEDHTASVAPDNSVGDGVTIPDRITVNGVEYTVVSIERYAFYECMNLRVIELPSTLKSIGDYAFARCHLLDSVTIPSSVTSIGEEAFRDCGGFSSIEIPASVTTIGTWAFFGDNLTSVEIPASVTSIGSTPFLYCVKLRSILVADANPCYSSDGGVLFNKDKTAIEEYPAGKTAAFYEIPDSVTQIKENAFCGTKLSSVTIPSSVTQICDSAFFGSAIVEVTIPASVTSIGHGAFGACDQLSRVFIESADLSIGDHCFYDSSLLSAIYFAGSKDAWAAVPKSNGWSRHTQLGDDPDAKQVTLKVVNGAWNDGTTEDRVITLVGNDATALLADLIPAVGGKPNAHCSAGSWDTDPATAEITEDTVFTYTYAKESYEVIWKYENGLVIDAKTFEYGTMPTREDPVMEGNAEFTYVFAGWVPEVKEVTGPAVYTAHFNEVRNSYEITWKNDEGAVVDVTTVEYGELPQHEDLRKDATAEFSYIFAGWTPEFETVTGTATYTATYNAERRSYEITWKDEDGSVFDVTTCEYGATPVHPDPPNTEDIEFSYIFAGWTPEVAAVTGTATYTATFTAERHKYEISWLNEDGSLIDTTTVEYGQTPTHDDPSKAATAQYTYTFTGWTPEVAAVTGDAAYQATYTAARNSYRITWLNDDGSVLVTTVVPFGTVPAHVGPVKEADAQFTYIFSGWTPELASVNGDATYKAAFTATANEYTVTFKNEDGTVLQTLTVPYGETPAFTGETPAKTEDGQNTYTFAGWTPELTAVTGDATYTATFTAVPKPVPDKSYNIVPFLVIVGVALLAVAAAAVLIPVLAKKRKKNK